MNIWTNISVTNKFTFKKRKYEENFNFCLDDDRIELTLYSLYCKEALSEYNKHWARVMHLSGEQYNTFHFKSDYVYDWVKTELPHQTNWKRLSDVHVPPKIYEEIRKELLKFCNAKHR